MKDYMVLSLNDEDVLAAQVKAFLVEGWKLQGGVSVTWWHYDDPHTGNPRDGFRYAQAMVKDA
jgi:hypothetical protein